MEIRPTSGGIEQAESELAIYKSKFASELPELHAANVTRLSHLRAVVAERKTALEGAIAEEEKLRERLSLTNPVVGKIESALAHYKVD